jgi:hypothetical protein
MNILIYSTSLDRSYQWYTLNYRKKPMQKYQFAQEEYTQRHMCVYMDAHIHALN